jgi:glycosyltransferase involved in cell wall biosynthesis
LKIQSLPKKLLVFNQSGGYLTVDVVNASLAHFEEVVLYSGELRFMERPLDERVRFLKTIQYKRGNIWRKLISWTAATGHLFFLILFKYRSYHVLYYTNPPISYFCSLILRNSFSVVVFDVYPEALKTLGLSERNPVYKLWRTINRRLLHRAQQVTTLSEGMKELILLDAPNANVITVPPWTGSSLFRRFPANQNEFRIKYGLEGKFLILYSGNLGGTHPIERLLDLACRFKGTEDLVFVINGEGSKKKMVEVLISRYNLDNVILSGYQPFELLPHTLAAADLGVVTLEENAASLSVPSKTFNLIAAGAPLLCLASEKSELGRLVDRYQNGAVFEPNDISSMESFVREMLKDKALQKKMSENSLKASQDFHFSRASEYFHYV